MGEEIPDSSMWTNLTDEKSETVYGWNKIAATTNFWVKKKEKNIIWNNVLYTLNNNNVKNPTNDIYFIVALRLLV